MDDIVEKLQRRRASHDRHWEPDALSQEAADEIKRLRAQNAKLKKALSPFIAGVHNDNGDVTVCRAATTLDDVEDAYWAVVNASKDSLV